MRILYIHGNLQFAQSNVALLDKKKPTHKHTIVIRSASDEAIELLESDPFDMVISSIAIPNNSESAGKEFIHTGGIDLYEYILKRNKEASKKDRLAFCFQVRCDKCVAERVLVKSGYPVTKEAPLIFGRGTYLPEIVEVMKKQKHAAQPTAIRPDKRKTAEGKMPPAVDRKLQR